MINFFLKYLQKYSKELIILALSVVVAVFMTKSCNQSKEIDRLTTNFYAVSDSVVYYKTESGKNAAKTKQAELTLEEFKTSSNKEIAHLKKIIDDLNIKLKKISGAATGTTKIYIKDTVYLKDSLSNGGILYKTGHYHDTWTDIFFYVSKDTLNFDLSTADTIDIITHKEKIGKFRLKNIFIPRKVVYSTTATMTRPNGKIEVNSFIIKK